MFVDAMAFCPYCCRAEPKPKYKTEKRRTMIRKKALQLTYRKQGRGETGGKGGPDKTPGR